MRPLTEELMWRVTVTNDPGYDGVFYYGVTSTRIFCRPSCKSKAPQRRNVMFFASPQEALAQGYRPCKRCQPVLNGPFQEPIIEIMEQVMAILQTEYHSPGILADLPRRVGVSPFHLLRSFKKQTGSSPKAFLQDVRVNKAKELLGRNEGNNTDIGFAVGFGSLSSFYHAFRAATGVAPGAYQRSFVKNRSGGCDELSL